VSDQTWSTHVYYFLFRYGLVENSDKKVMLYSTHIPLIRKKTSPSYITKWNAVDFQCKREAMLSEEIISCMDVRWVNFHDKNQLELGTIVNVT
jgi:hypothetical protein